MPISLSFRDMTRDGQTSYATTVTQGCSTLSVCEQMSMWYDAGAMDRRRRSRAVPKDQKLVLFQFYLTSKHPITVTFCRHDVSNTGRCPWRCSLTFLLGELIGHHRMTSSTGARRCQPISNEIWTINNGLMAHLWLLRTEPYNFKPSNFNIHQPR